MLHTWRTSYKSINNYSIHYRSSLRCILLLRQVQSLEAQDDAELNRHTVNERLNGGGYIYNHLNSSLCRTIGPGRTPQTIINTFDNLGLAIKYFSVPAVWLDLQS